jgi:aconitase A
MIAAGLLAKKAVEKGLTVPPWVKTSLAPGSRVVTDYYTKAGLLPYLEKLRFNVVGYGCTTCIGNSGPLPADVSDSINEHGLVAVSVLSGNRNFEGRVNVDVRANYLMSPPLVVAYAIAGRIDHDFDNESLGLDKTGNAVFLKDIWPTQAEVSESIAKGLSSEGFTQGILDRHRRRQQLAGPQIPPRRHLRVGARLHLHPQSPLLRRHHPTPAPIEDIAGARVLAILGDSVTTDHISPAGSIKPTAPPANTSPNTASNPPTSTATARAAATTKSWSAAPSPTSASRTNSPPAPKAASPACSPKAPACPSTTPASSTPSAAPARHPRRQGIRLRQLARLGRQRTQSCSASAPSSPKASSASTAATSSAWASCRSSSPTAKPSNPTA